MRPGKGVFGDCIGSTSPVNHLKRLKTIGEYYPTNYSTMMKSGNKTPKGCFFFSPVTMASWLKDQ